MVKTLTEYAQEIADINRANGWYDVERPFDDDIALLHSEISEMYEGHRKGDAANVAEEMADILIRLLDTAHRYRLDVSELSEYGRYYSEPRAGRGPVGEDAARLHKLVSSMYSASPNGLDSFWYAFWGQAVDYLYRMASAHGVDLLAEMDKKLVKNRARGYRHGGKVV